MGKAKSQKGGRGERYCHKTGCASQIEIWNKHRRCLRHLHCAKDEPCPHCVHWDGARWEQAGIARKAAARAETARGEQNPGASGAGFAAVRHIQAARAAAAAGDAQLADAPADAAAVEKDGVGSAGEAGGGGRSPPPMELSPKQGVRPEDGTEPLSPGNQLVARGASPAASSLTTGGRSGPGMEMQAQLESWMKEQMAAFMTNMTRMTGPAGPAGPASHPSATVTRGQEEEVPKRARSPSPGQQRESSSSPSSAGEGAEWLAGSLPQAKHTRSRSRSPIRRHRSRSPVRSPSPWSRWGQKDRDDVRDRGSKYNQLERQLGRRRSPPPPLRLSTPDSLHRGGSYRGDTRPPTITREGSRPVKRRRVIPEVRDNDVRDMFNAGWIHPPSRRNTRSPRRHSSRGRSPSSSRRGRSPVSHRRSPIPRVSPSREGRRASLSHGRSPTPRRGLGGAVPAGQGTERVNTWLSSQREDSPIPDVSLVDHTIEPASWSTKLGVIQGEYPEACKPGTRKPKPAKIVSQAEADREQEEEMEDATVKDLPWSAAQMSAASRFQQATTTTTGGRKRSAAQDVSRFHVIRTGDGNNQASISQDATLQANETARQLLAPAQRKQVPSGTLSAEQTRAVERGLRSGLAGASYAGWFLASAQKAATSLNTVAVAQRALTADLNRRIVEWANVQTAGGEPPSQEMLQSLMAPDSHIAGELCTWVQELILSADRAMSFATGAITGQLGAIIGARREAALAGMKALDLPPEEVKAWKYTGLDRAILGTQPELFDPSVVRTTVDRIKKEAEQNAPLKAVIPYLKAQTTGTNQGPDKKRPFSSRPQPYRGQTAGGKYEDKSAQKGADTKVQRGGQQYQRGSGTKSRGGSFRRFRPSGGASRSAPGGSRGKARGGANHR